MKRVRYLFLLIILILSVFFSMPEQLRAEIAVFRINRSTPEHPNFHSCMPMSLTENLSAKITGETGRNCEFDVELTPAGEWVSVGGFFDSPPYAWERDKFYSISKGDFSYTCKNSSYSLDTGSLPSYVQVIDEI